MLDLYEILLTN